MNGKEKDAIDERLKGIYKSCYSSIYRFCLTRLKENRDVVEDLTQEVFVVLYNKMLNGEMIDNPHAYLFKIADNIVKQYYAKIKKERVVVSLDEVVELPTDSKDLDEHLSFEQYSKEFSAALSDTDAELFSMRYIQELKITEIADITGLSIQYITTRLYRIREKLRKQYGDKINT